MRSSVSVPETVNLFASSHEKAVGLNSCVPSSVTILTWFSVIVNLAGIQRRPLSRIDWDSVSDCLFASASNDVS